jgi:hypothetical protein
MTHMMLKDFWKWSNSVIVKIEIYIIKDTFQNINIIKYFNLVFVVTIQYVSK